MNSHQDDDTIRAEDIQKGDTIEFPCNDPGVQWHVDEVRASLGSPLGDLYTFTVKEVGRELKSSSKSGAMCLSAAISETDEPSRLC